MNKADQPVTLVDDYYRDPTPDIEPGAICWGPSLYLVEGLSALRVQYVEPGNEKNVLLKLVSSRDTKLFDHEPIKHPPVRKTEEFLTVKAKVRGLIVLSLRSDPVEGRFGGYGFPESHVVAPIYTFRAGETREEGEEDYDPEFVERVKYFVYHQFFYLPASDHYGIRESFARFDRVQVVARRNLDRPQVRLTLNALTVLRDLLTYYLTGVPEQNIEDVRRDYMKAKGLA